MQLRDARRAENIAFDRDQVRPRYGYTVGGGIGGRCRSVRRVLRRIRVTNEVTRQRFTGAGVKPFRKGASDLGAWLGEKVNLASVNSHPPSELVCPGLETIGYAANIRDGNGIAGSGVELG